MSAVPSPLSAAFVAETAPALRPPRTDGHDVTRPAGRPPRSPHGTWRRRPLTRAVAWPLAALLIATFVIGTLVEPEPNGPEPVPPGWVVLLFMSTVLGIFGGVVALTAVQRAGVWLAAVAGAGLLVLTVTCPTSGHHIPGNYLYVQYALSGLLTLAAVGVLAATRGPTRDW